MARNGPKDSRRYYYARKERKAAERFDITRYNINPKKWTNARERKNIDDALEYMEKLFGDISDVTGEIKKKRLSGAMGMHEHGLVGLDGFSIPKETLFDTGSFISTDTAVHEFTHAVAETLAHNARALGFDSSEDFYDKLRTAAYSKAGREEPKYDGRKWKDRALEFPAIQIENYYRGNTHGSGASEISDATLSLLQKYWKRYRKKK